VPVRLLEGLRERPGTPAADEPWRFSPFDYVLLGLVIGVIATWSIVALRTQVSWDLGLAYHGGAVAWRTGRPESLATWISTPFLAMVMAFTSRVVSERTATLLLTIVNLLLLWGGVAIAWTALRTRLPRGLWLLTLFGAAAFAPALSSLWWKQLNVVVLALAVAAFAAIRRQRAGWAGAAVALSLLIKPILVLLPVFLLLGRQTRRAVVVASAWAVGLLALSQGFLALRAHSLGALSPLAAYRNFSAKSLPANIWVCHAENFSPQSALCRVVGADHWNLQRVLVAGAVLLAVAVYVHTVWSRPSTSWSWFAGACLLSPMVGPIAWSHYQILLAPMFVLLVVEFHRTRASAVTWAWLATGFLLAELVWRPFGTAPGLVQHFLDGRTETTNHMFRVFVVAMFAQYLVLLAALVHFRSGGRQAPARGCPRRRRPPPTG
jgi:hypothetical protein